MNNDNREIEVKLVITGSTLGHVKRVFEGLGGADLEHMIEGRGRDKFWPTSLRAEADFVRLREAVNGGCELTVKAKDRLGNLNRMEMNADVDSSWDHMSTLLTTVLGEHIGIIDKSYFVYHSIELADIVLCIYEVVGDENQRVFVEVEGLDDDVVMESANGLRLALKKGGLTITRCHESLYEMFIAP